MKQIKKNKAQRKIEYPPSYDPAKERNYVLISSENIQ
jgi:hypothetical protein